MQKITPFLWFDNNAEEAMNSILHLQEFQSPDRFAIWRGWAWSSGNSHDR